MPGTQTYKLDGKTYTVPAGTSLDELSDFIRSSDPLVTGKGMEGKAHEQASEELQRPIENAQHPGESNLHFRESQKIGRPAMQKQADQFNEAAPYIAGAAGVAMPFVDAGGLIPGAVKLATSAAGGYAGSHLGKRYGGPIGEVAGGLIGSTLGYGAPNMAEGVANRVVGEENVPMWLKSPQTVGRMVDTARDEMYNDLGEARMNRPDEVGSPSNPGFMAKLPSRMPREPQTVDPVVQAVREGRAAKIPTRMPAAVAPAPELGSPENPGWNVPLPGRMPEAATAEAELGTAENPGFHARLPTRMPKVMTPKTATTNVGGEELPEIPGVIVAPEPRPLAPGEKPGSMYSVPRARLKGMAKTGKPGAVDVLRDIGQPSVLVPREGVGYPGPRAEMGAPSLEDIQDAIRRRPQIAAD